MPTIREGIYRLLSAVRIDTKEEGRTHIQPWLSQRMVIDMVCDGLENNVHDFAILKCRQVACTTVCQVIELFWVLAHGGVQGAIVADRGDNLERLRRIFASMLQTLPPEWAGRDHRLLRDNKFGLEFANGSILDLLAAASNPDLGASRSLSLMHATECGQWKSLAGVESLKAALADKNPNRLFLWESISNGFNWWYSHCQQAKQDRHMRFCFLGFWSNPNYSIPRDDPDYRVYWDGSLTEDEITRARYVRENYKYTITPEQIAWWRREHEFKQTEYMLRHYPWHEVECFIASGTGFFPAKRTLEIAQQLGNGPPYKGYKYVFEDAFIGSRIEQVKRSEDAQLKVWEPPEPGGVYAIGVDPSGGGGDDADDHSIQVLRCYADRVVQVAQYQSNVPLTYQFAWVLCHLCGAYRDHKCNLEVTGIGAAIPAETNNLRALAMRGILQAEAGPDNPILQMIGNIQWFLFKRADTLAGAGSTIHWKSNADNKLFTYSELRDSLMLRRVEIRSPTLIEQLQAIVEDDGYLAAGPDTGINDDLVSAFVLAHHAWVEWLRQPLINRRLTWDKVKGEHPPQTPATVLSFAFSEHFDKINRKSRERREKF